MYTPFYGYSSTPVAWIHAQSQTVLQTSLLQTCGCPPNSPDINAVDYAIWSIIQLRVYQTRVHDIDELPRFRSAIPEVR